MFRREVGREFVATGQRVPVSPAPRDSKSPACQVCNLFLFQFLEFWSLCGVPHLQFLDGVLPGVGPDGALCGGGDGHCTACASGDCGKSIDIIPNPNGIVHVSTLFVCLHG